LDYHLEDEDDTGSFNKSIQILMNILEKKTLQEKLEDLFSFVNYESFASDAPWQKLKIARDIMVIVQIIHEHSKFQLKEHLPTFMFLFRNRMLQSPSSIAELLPLSIQCLALVRLT
jgi:hypothetical protein